jgi:peptide/nickel transport system permease protein
VSDALSTRVPLSLSIIIFTLLLTVVFSVLLGVVAAVRGGATDRTVQIVSVLGAAVPAFIVAIVLVFTFAIALRWLPATGYVPITQSVSGWLKSVILPVIALLVGAVAGAAAQFRTAVLDTANKDFVRTLRAHGISERNIVWRHVLRNSAGPGMIALSLTMIALLGGVIFIESVFAMPGLGQLSLSSSLTSDVPMVMGVVLVIVLIVLVVNFLADLATYFLNPKARTR